jgi:hypothetical protein
VPGCPLGAVPGCPLGRVPACPLGRTQPPGTAADEDGDASPAAGAAGPLTAADGAAAGPAAPSATVTAFVDVPDDTDARAGMATAARATTPPAIAV